jgi:hypothetical protein
MHHYLSQCANYTGNDLSCFAANAEAGEHCRDLKLGRFSAHDDTKGVGCFRRAERLVMREPSDRQLEGVGRNRSCHG